jgi:hypothetical protein
MQKYFSSAGVYPRSFHFDQYIESAKNAYFSNSVPEYFSDFSYNLKDTQYLQKIVICILTKRFEMFMKMMNICKISFSYMTMSRSKLRKLTVIYVTVSVSRGKAFSNSIVTMNAVSFLYVIWYATCIIERSQLFKILISQ